MAKVLVVRGKDITESFLSSEIKYSLALFQALSTERSSEDSKKAIQVL